MYMMLVYVSEQKGLSGLSFNCHFISSIRCILLLNPRISVAVQTEYSTIFQTHANNIIYSGGSRLSGKGIPTMYKGFALIISSHFS